MRPFKTRRSALAAALGLVAIAALAAGVSGLRNGSPHASSVPRQLAAQPTSGGGAGAGGRSAQAHVAKGAGQQTTKTSTTGATRGAARDASASKRPSDGAHRHARARAPDHAPSLPTPAAPAKARVAGGGLSISPGIFEHTANPGSLGSIKISNTSAAPMAVKVALRPWLQARSGEVSPNRRRTLREVRVSSSSFTLPAGSSQTLGMSLARTPKGRSQYGGIEVSGLPSARATNGVKVAYRVVSSMRLDPPKGSQSFHARGGRLIEQGNARHGTLLLAVRNTGNTISPIGGSVLISGAGHSLRASATPKAIVPGATVNIPLTQLLGSLPPGPYKVSVRLSQAGRGLGTVKRTINLR